MSSETQARRLKRSLPRLLKRESLSTLPSHSCVKRRGLRANLISPLQTGRAKTAKPRLQNRAKSDQKASCEREARAVIEELMGAINKLPDIETPEREDAYVAVRQIADNARFEIPQSKTQEWFDAVRDF